MKLPIKHKYFQDIKDGKKSVELRSAHITFVDEETGDELRKDVLISGVTNKVNIELDKHTSTTVNERKKMFKDDNVIYFGLD